MRPISMFTGVPRYAVSSSSTVPVVSEILLLMPVPAYRAGYCDTGKGSLHLRRSASDDTVVGAKASQLYREVCLCLYVWSSGIEWKTQ